MGYLFRPSSHTAKDIYLHPKQAVVITVDDVTTVVTKETRKTTIRISDDIDEELIKKVRKWLGTVVSVVTVTTVT